MKLLWGDLHNHCGITYGFGSLENALKAARGTLDFCSVTGHAMWPDMYEKNPDTAFIVDFHNTGFKKLYDHWEQVRKTMADANSEELVTFQGYEMHSSYYGDHHFVSPDDNFPLIYRNSPAELVRDCGCRAIAVPHHIGYVPGYRGICWDEFDSNISPIVEVYSKHGCAMSDSAPYAYYHDMGPRVSANTIKRGLEMGKQFSFVASTDHHAGFPGSYGDGLAAVLAKSKTREDIWEALLAGRTYAVTGDRIECDFTINGQMVGSKFAAAKRDIVFKVKAEDEIDKVVLYKNGRPVKVVNGEMLDNKENGKYKIRLELGWGKPEEYPYRWEGSIRAVNGKIVGKNPYWRGRSVLSPTQTDDSAFDNINDLTNELTQNGDTELTFIAETFKNKSTLHPMTSHIVFEVEGGEDTQLIFNVNGREHVFTIAQMLKDSFAEHMKPYHYVAYKIHAAIPQSAYETSFEYSDTAQSDCDYYHVEVAQKNWHYAFVSPIFVY